MVVTRYINPGEHLGLHLALITDLHNCENQQLLESVEMEAPDFVFCAGDILERHDEGASEWTCSRMDTVINSIGKPCAGEKIMWLLDRITERTGRATHETEDTAIEFLKALTSVAHTI